MPTQSRTAAIVGIHNTRQARRLDGSTSRSLTIEAIRGALDDAGLTLSDVDGISAGPEGATLIHDMRLGPAWQGSNFGIGMVQEAIAAVEQGLTDVAVLVAAQAGAYTDHAATAPWTRPENEFVAPWGMFTAAEFALVARRHMEIYGTTRDQLSIVASTIRNNGHRNPDAVYFGRGPFEPDDIVASRPIADPFHLLDCAMTSEGGCALVIANVERSNDLRKKPIHVLGTGSDFIGPSYQFPPTWDLAGRDGRVPNGLIGRRAADLAFAQAGLERSDVDVLELYDPFSFEIIRQLEAFRFVSEGEGGPFVADGHIGPTGTTPVTTDGGLMSFSHAGSNPQMLQRVIRGVQQLRNEAGPLQVPNARVALCSNGGAGALFNTVVLLGDEPS
ncbi:thiolase family protein [Rhodococcus sp. IEGM 1366]|uniref:thiolase family protein n=1 Tax=Rhodococcus sp. IEGM 1366 TaxID=3082223 RepID=UPI002953FF08|nr:thiolase family protein [Rhodococcus sp. IEGM 1366]MDV8071369.1 thiolase family protein [Rhodococcus sp. IEGM 1366]